MKNSKHNKVTEHPAVSAKKIVLSCAVFVVLLITLGIGCLAQLLHAGKQSIHGENSDGSYAEVLKIGNKTYTLNPNVASILFIGTDKDNGRAVPPHNGQADAIMLLAFDEGMGKITCLSISRSAWATVLERNFDNGLINEKETYLCLGYNYGYDDQNSSELICQDVSKLLNGVPINSYFTLNMAGIGVLADAVGGINLTAFSDMEEMGIIAGDQVELFGDTARDYVWQRDEEADYSSAERLQRQEQFVKVFASKALEQCKSNPLKMFALFDSAKEYSVTDLDFPELAYIASFIARHGVSEINVVPLPGDYVPVPDQPTRFEVDEMQLIQMVTDVFYTEVS